jgi:acyl-coenzyme A synthetase/AMP-(fatty) acid ligase
MIPQLIFDWAQKTPGKTALIHNGRHLTYGAFANLIAQARRHLKSRGCTGPGFAILAVRNLMDVWILGLALRSQGLHTMAVWPAGLPHIRLPDVRCVVSSAREAWPRLDEVCAARGWEHISVPLNGEGAPDRDVLATAMPAGGHVLLTSGTTGRKKKALMAPEHDAAFLQEIVDSLKLDWHSALCVFNFTAWTGIGYKWAASPWLVGGTTIIAQTNAPHRALRRPEITHAVLGPSLLDRLLSAPDSAFPRNDALLLAVGAGPITRSQFENAQRRITAHLVNVLASTEGGVIGLTPLHGPEDLRWHRLAPGRVVEIVDDQDRPVPAGETGLVRIATDRLTHYLHDDAASAEFFRKGYFYPGDLAVMRTDGRMALQGRANDVIQVNGSKFAPELFEHKLRELVGAAVCLLSLPARDGEELHLVIESSAPKATKSLMAQIAKGVPAAGPMRIHCMAQLPRTDMGKILRAKLRERLMAEAHSERVIPAGS